MLAVGYCFFFHSCPLSAWGSSLPFLICWRLLWKRGVGFCQKFFCVYSVEVKNSVRENSRLELLRAIKDQVSTIPWFFRCSMEAKWFDQNLWLLTIDSKLFSLGYLDVQESRVRRITSWSHRRQTVMGRSSGSVPYRCRYSSGVYEPELLRMWMPQSKIRLFGFHLSTTAYQLMTLGMELNLSGQ